MAASDNRSAALLPPGSITWLAAISVTAVPTVKADESIATAPARASARARGPRGQPATSAARAVTAPQNTNAQGTPPGWSTITPPVAPPAALAATVTVTTQVYASFLIEAGAIRPTSENSTVSTGAIVAPPIASATPSASGVGISA